MFLIYKEGYEAPVAEHVANNRFRFEEDYLPDMMNELLGIPKPHHFSTFINANYKLVFSKCDKQGTHFKVLSDSTELKQFSILHFEQ